MTLNEVDPERLELVNRLNVELGHLAKEVTMKIAIGVCEAYKNCDPIRICMIQLMTVMKFSSEIQAVINDAVIHGLEEVGVMKTVPNEQIRSSPEFKAMVEHYKRLEKQK